MNGQRVLRPLEIKIPLKAGTKFQAMVNVDADGGEGLVVVDIDRVWDFNVRLTIEDYGTLGNLIEALQKAQEAELGRIKRSVRGSKPRSGQPIGNSTLKERRERRRRKK